MNNTIFFFFYNLAHQSVLMDRLIVFTAEIFPYLVLILAGLFILFHHEIFRADNPFQVLRQKYKEMFPVFFSVIFAYLIAYVLKILLHAPRPFTTLNGVDSLFMQTDYAFPSGHAMVFMALAIAIFLTHKKAGYIFIFFAILIGLARIIAGVHFPADILGGFILGAALAVLTRYAFFQFAYFRGKM
jgi:membrane-associated phospholipid phosphatase